jgi:hypothetical protein
MRSALGEHAGRRRLRWSVVVALFAIGLGVLAEPAAAEVHRGTDPRGDERMARGDVLAYRVDHGDWIVFRVRPRRPANPYTAPAWQAGVTRVEWLIDTNGSGGVAGWEYWAYADGDGGRFTAEVIRRGGQPACTARATFPDGEAYQVRFRRSCIGDPSRIKVRGVLLYDGLLSNPGPEGEDVFGEGWSPPVDYR